jgi:lipoprotein-releasing system permease protein
MRLEVFLARRYLAARKGRGLSVIGWIALSGVIVGVMSLVAVLAVMSGFDRELRSKILGNNAHIFVQVIDPTEEGDVSALLPVVEATRGVQAAMPSLYSGGFVLSPRGGAEGVFIKGVDPERVQRVLDLNLFVREKNWKGFEGYAAILGRSLADQMGLEVGDSFTVVLNRGDFSPLGLTPRMQKFVVSDIFYSGMSQYDSRHMYVPLLTAEKLFDTQARSLEIRTTDPRMIDKVSQDLQERLGLGVRVSDWISQNKEFLSALQLEKMVMGIILGLIVLVAAFNICGSLIMIVKDKSRDIAILKSMGAENGTVLRIFFLQGFSLGLVGTIVGVILGLALAIALRDFVRFPLDRSVYMIDTLPVDIRVSDVAGVAFGAIVISCVATFYPARLAARMVPTEGLKHDG